MIFEVDGLPIAKARPRVANGHAYTPTRTKAYEDAVAWAAKEHMTERGLDMFEGAVAVSLYFWLPDHRNEPDLDNLVKAAMDGMNKIVYADDKQVHALIAHKNFDKARPRTVIDVIQMES